MKHTLPGGFLLALEGIDGAGKSVQARAVAAALAARGLDVVLTREPTDGPWGRKIRASAAGVRMEPAQELEAFIEDRRQHVRELIQPSLAAGRIVITDRYYFSTVAYQGARGFDPAELLRVNEAFAVEPHLLIFLMLSPEDALARIGERDGRGNAFETLQQLSRTREIFDGLAKPYLVRLDAARPREELTAAILFSLSCRVLERLAGQAQLTPEARLEAALRFHGGPMTAS